MSLSRSVAVLGVAGAAVLAVAGPAGAATTPARVVLTGSVSVSAVRGALPVGADLSVVQTCPQGSVLDRTQTAAAEHAMDAATDPHLRLASRELWVAGIVSRYSVRTATTATTVLPLVDAVLCSTPVAPAATTVSGTASTDLRVWGPAPAGVQLVNATVTLVTDTAAADYVYATVMRAAGAGASRGSLPGAVHAVQATAQKAGIGAVSATGRSSARVRRGQFVSIYNSYRYTSDLTTKVTKQTLSAAR